jgi:hypothetical protein
MGKVVAVCIDRPVPAMRMLGLIGWLHGRAAAKIGLQITS